VRHHRVNQFIASGISIVAAGVFTALIGAKQTTAPPVEIKQSPYLTSDLSDLSSQLSYVRPTTADNGVPFPSTSSYIDGYPVKATGGYSTVTVDNSKSTSDMFVKLYARNKDVAEPVSVFFILAGEQFTVEDIKPGKYDIRYRDLGSGAFARTEPFDLIETETAEGVEFQNLTLTLYTVAGGTMEIHPISEDEF
jgi:hypothetical protein